MTTLHDTIVRELNLEARRLLPWLPEIPDSDNEEYQARFRDPKTTRKQLRILANAAVAVLLSSDYEAHMHSELRRIRRISSRSAASSAANRLLRMYRWAIEEKGENAGGGSTSQLRGCARCSVRTTAAWSSLSATRTWQDTLSL